MIVDTLHITSHANTFKLTRDQRIQSEMWKAACSDREETGQMQRTQEKRQKEREAKKMEN